LALTWCAAPFSLGRLRTLAGTLHGEPGSCIVPELSRMIYV